MPRESALLRAAQHQLWRRAEALLCLPPAAPLLQHGWRHEWLRSTDERGGTMVSMVFTAVSLFAAAGCVAEVQAAGLRDAVAVAAAVAAALAGFDLAAAEEG
eukprot:gene27690-12351_t